MKYYYKAPYLKCFDRLDRKKQELVIKTDILIKEYLQKGTAPFGLRVKRLYQGVYEGRVNDQLRIVWVKAEDEVVFSLLGNHEDVRRFLKNL